MKNLNKLAEASKPFELDVEAQATIIGLAIKVSNQGVPYFTKANAIAIKKALVADKVITKATVLFEKLKTSQKDAWYRPTNDWLSLEAQEVETDDDTI